MSESVSLKIYNFDRNERNALIVTRLREQLELTHTITVDHRPWRRKMMLRPFGANGERLEPQQVDELAENCSSYHIVCDLRVNLSTNSREPDTLVFPIIDKLVEVLLGVVGGETRFGLGDESFENLPNKPHPCSVQTLQRLLSNDNTVDEIAFENVTIGPDLCAAFEGQHDKCMKLYVNVCNIPDYQGFGQSLCKYQGLSELCFYGPIVDDQAATFVTTLRKLVGHENLTEVFLQELPQLDQQQFDDLWEVIGGMNLRTFGVAYSNHEPTMPEYAFYGLWNMLAEHPTISHVCFGHHVKKFSKDQHLDAVRMAVRKNPNIVQLRGGEWHGDVELDSLLKRNKRHWRVLAEIDDLASRSVASKSDWIELVSRESDSVSCLYQILNANVGAVNGCLFPQPADDANVNNTGPAAAGENSISDRATTDFAEHSGEQREMQRLEQQQQLEQELAYKSYDQSNDN